MTNDKKFPSAIVSSQGLRSLFGNARPGDPSSSQIESEIASYYRNVTEGDVAIIRETYARRLWFIVSKITGTNPKLGRVYLEDAPKSGYGGTAFYMKSGKNSFAPKGQASLVVPTPEVLEHARQYPEGDFGQSFDIPYGDVVSQLRSRRQRE
jgi:hypothetical protein